MNITSGHIQSSVTLPTSKSIANRLLILAALSDQEVSISKIPLSDDVQNLINSLRQVGLVIDQKEDSVIIKKSFPACEINNQLVSVGEGGTTLHFLIALLSLGSKKYQLQMDDTLAKRPHEDLLKALASLGVQAIEKNNIITIQGPIVKENVTVDSSKSSQYASALSLIAKKANLKLNIEKLTSSKSFYALTQNIISHFSENNTVPVDMASLSYPLVYSLLNQEIMIQNCEDIDFDQPDAKIYQLFSNNISLKDNGLLISPLENKKPFSLDMSNCLDMIPSMAFLASYLNGESKIIGIKNLIYKESDRLKWIQYLLNAFEVNYKMDDDTLSITGRSPINVSKDLKLPPDHRIVMTAFLFLKHNGGGSLDSESSVKKSFPDFFKILNC